MWGSSLPLTCCAVQLFWMPQSEATRDDAPWRFFAISAGFFSSFLLHLTVFNLKNCNCASISHLPRARHTHSHTAHTTLHKASQARQICALATLRRLMERPERGDKQASQMRKYLPTDKRVGQGVALLQSLPSPHSPIELLPTLRFNCFPFCPLGKLAE